MSKIYFTLTGTKHYFGKDFFENRNKDSFGKGAGQRIR